MRYLRLYLHFLRFSFSRALEFRLDFWFRVVMDTVYYLVNLSFYKLVYLTTPVLAGWREDQAMLFVASYLLIDALQMTVFSTNMWWLPVYVNRGDMDSYLTRPVNTLFFVSLREFSANSAVNLVMAVGIFAWAVAGLQDPFTLGEFAFYLLLLLNGFLLFWVLQMLFIIPVFWTQSPRGFSDFFLNVSPSFERPDLVYRGGVRALFTVVFPFALVASFPARWFLGPLDPWLLPHLAVMTVVMWGLMLWIWGRGLRAYSSASS